MEQTFFHDQSTNFRDETSRRKMKSVRMYHAVFDGLIQHSYIINVKHSCPRETRGQDAARILFPSFFRSAKRLRILEVPLNIARVRRVTKKFLFRDYKILSHLKVHNR